MAPIKVGFLGLSASGWAPHAHLPYMKDNGGEYEIVAICNSSVRSSKEAIKLYNLPSSVKAYGNPEDLAKDANVDLVVCSVRVDRHLETVAPSLKAGKDVLVEWPLGKSAAEARELLRLKNSGGVKNGVVDLQARQAPVIRLLKELVDEGEKGRLGKALSSTWTGQAGAGGPSSTQQAYELLGNKKVGGNLVTIHFGHSIDYIQYVLGYGFETAKSVLANRRPEIRLLDNDNKLLEEKATKTADDTIFLTGTLKSGIPLSFSLRGGRPFKGQPGLDWRIYGSKAELRITASGLFLNVGSADIKVEIHDFEADTVEEIPLPKDEFEGKEGFGFSARNVARVYKALAKGENNASFEDAVERHEFIEQLYKENGYVEGSA